MPVAEVLLALGGGVASNALYSVVVAALKATASGKAEEAIRELERLQEQDAELKSVISPLIDGVRTAIHELSKENDTDHANIEQALEDIKTQLGPLMARLAPGPSEWLTRFDPNCLIAMLLVGKWSPENPADSEVVTKLCVGRTSQDVENLCVNLTADDGPIMRLKSTWQWKSAEEAWLLLAKRISDSQLKAFLDVAVTVLSEIDPKYEMPMNERMYAGIRGKALTYSEELRKGIAESIVMLSIHNKDLKQVYNTSKGEVAAKTILIRVLTPEWQKWASLSDVLPILAESSPSQFLTQMDASLARESDGLIEVFRQESEWGSPHCAILWSLEILGWNTERMPQVAFLLAELAEKEPGGRIMNRPIASLSKLLHFEMPQTMADLARRFDVLKAITGRYPQAGWCLLIGYIDALRGGMLIPSSQPHFLQLNLPCEFNRVSPEEAGAYFQEIVHLAIDKAETNPERWAKLLEAIRFAPDIYEALVLSKIEELRNHLQGSEILCDSMRSYIEGLYLSDEPQEKHGKILEHALSLYTQFQPQSPNARYAWLFSGERIQLPEPRNDDWQHREERLKELRISARQEVLDSSENKTEVFKDFAQVVQSQRTLGECCGSFPDQQVIEGIILALQKPDSSYRDLLRGYCRAVSWTNGMVWVTNMIDRLIESRDIDGAVIVASNSPASKGLWEFLEAKNNDLAKKYWEAVPAIYSYNNISELETAIANLLVVDRPITAAEEINHCFYKKIEVPQDLILATLLGTRQYFNEGKAPNSSERQVLSHNIGELFSHLSPSSQDERNLIIQLEIYFHPILAHTKTSTKHLNKLLLNNPDVFAEYVSYIYRADSDSNEVLAQDSMTNEERQNAFTRAQTAYQILANWHEYPGKGMADNEQTYAIQTWVLSVFDYAKNKGRRKSAISEVAKVLARVPAANDGMWPCLAARELLESKNYPELSSYLSIARYNSRGMVQCDGGRSEQKLSEQYANWAKATRVKYPVTSRLLDEMAERYSRDAEREAEEARARMSE